MMRRSLILVVSLAAACSPSDEGNGSAAGPGGPRPAAVVTAASVGGDCTFNWDGKTVSEEALLDESVKLIMRAIEELGGIENVTEQTMPYLRLEAADGVPFSCVGPALRNMARAGFAHVVLKPAGGPALDQRADFPFAGEARTGPAAIVRLEKGRGMSWDGEAVDAAGLRERVRASRVTSPPVELFVAPSIDSDFRTLHDAVRAITHEKMTATLSGCEGTVGPVMEESPIC